MRSALLLARRGLGNVWPNPAVGCLIVREEEAGENAGGLAGRVVGRGWTQPAGRPHAETEALRRAGPAARGATAYVTLEPCAHHGQTPPCAEALIAAGVTRVVAAIEDPDMRVSGRGLKQLAVAGIEIALGVETLEAEEINAGFFMRTREGRPLVTLKLASTLDGRIATESGESKWITGNVARARAHLLRAEHDAILIGAGTALADDPALTCRLPGFAGRQPVRIVLIGRPQPDLWAKNIYRTASPAIPTWFVCAKKHASNLHGFQAAEGRELILCDGDVEGRPDIRAVLDELGKRGITRILVEGGGTIAAAFFKADRVDRIAWFQAPAVLGGDGRPAIGPMALPSIGAMPRFEPLSRQSVGEDGLVILRRMDQ
ncbi:MAG: bifunctional diaminohydroxyphosphoribosylaminopyrimidine deaminase/5-amino-6-(5-phosphoribosylamino)uracil reductase RibD [Alphaproteobacteria bacterium]|nr:bifunctional diaminohydroxyphosphoribosylaminopyrimidine deaminase/5-amino-6-(5-phosphoribosylamino)uracil reductase RibD [Alphaproteobacteria bacterium]